MYAGLLTMTQYWYTSQLGHFDIYSGSLCVIAIGKHKS